MRIIGIIGSEPIARQLIDALKRLEYRGYDPAGVATLEQNPSRDGVRKASAKI